MTVREWDADQAVTRGPLDEDLEGRCSIDRYGVLGNDEVAGEPLSVALEQEEADQVPSYGSDDQWVLVEDDWDVDDRLFHDDRDHGPEELAMHVELP